MAGSKHTKLGLLIAFMGEALDKPLMETMWMALPTVSLMGVLLQHSMKLVQTLIETVPASITRPAVSSSAIIPKLHEKAFNQMTLEEWWSRSKLRKIDQKIRVIFAREHYSAKFSHKFCVTNLP